MFLCLNPVYISHKCTHVVLNNVRNKYNVYIHTTRSTHERVNKSAQLDGKKNLIYV